MSDDGRTTKSIDYRYPHKTPYLTALETDSLILLQDIDDEDAASIFESGGWVIDSLRIYRGTLTKRVFFNDTIEGLLELLHDGEEFDRLVRPTASQTTFIQNLMAEA